MTTSNALQTCEHHEADLSAILDGELGTVDLTSTLDHLVDCPQCVAFYRRSRELDLAVAESRGGREAGESDAAIEPSADVWRRIAAEAPWAEASPMPDNVVALSQRRPRLMEWAPRLAAVLVLGFGLWMAHVVTRDAGSAELFQHSEASADVLSEDDVSEAAVGNGLRADSEDTDPGTAGPREMNEERFVQLATEVLQADTRYHYEMLEVMKTVTRAESREGTVDYRRQEENQDVSGSSGEDERAADGKLWK